jgi:hypothetical protein
LSLSQRKSEICLLASRFPKKELFRGKVTDRKMQRESDYPHKGPHKLWKSQAIKNFLQ